MFEDLPKQSLLEIVQMNASIGLAVLRSIEDVSVSDLASKLEITEQKLKNILFYNKSVTLKEIVEVAESLGYLVDVSFRKPGDPHPVQPWSHKDE